MDRLQARLLLLELPMVGYQCQTSPLLMSRDQAQTSSSLAWTNFFIKRDKLLVVTE